MHFLKSNCFLKTNLKTYTLKGSDSEKYLSGQLTTDVKRQKELECLMSSLIQLNGKVESFFYIYKFNSNNFLLFIEPEQEEQVIDRINKYIVIEDVEVSKLDIDIYGLMGADAILELAHDTQNTLFTYYYGLRTLFILDPSIIPDGMTEITYEDIEKYRILNGFPKYGKEVTENNLLTNTRLRDLALSDNKGCYLGQEVISKILSNRGENKKSKLLISDVQLADIKSKSSLFDDKFYYWIEVGRDKFLEDEIDGAKLNDFPSVSELQSVESNYYYEKALTLYNQDTNLEKVKNLLEKAVHIMPSHLDALEILAVIESKLGNLKEAIKTANKLIELAPNNVMGYTNLSQFYMLDGDIDKAEEMKAKSFTVQLENEDDAKDAEKEKIEELNRKEQMFNDVLKIDSEDVMALNGLGEINYTRGMIGVAIDFFKRALSSDDKYSVAYSNLAQAYYDQSKYEDVRDIISKGMDIALKKGEMVPANNMKRLLTLLPKS